MISSFIHVGNFLYNVWICCFKHGLPISNDEEITDRPGGRSAVCCLRKNHCRPVQRAPNPECLGRETLTLGKQWILFHPQHDTTGWNKALPLRILPLLCQCGVWKAKGAGNGNSPGKRVISRLWSCRVWRESSGYTQTLSRARAFVCLKFRKSVLFYILFVWVRWLFGDTCDRF